MPSKALKRHFQRPGYRPPQPVCDLDRAVILTTKVTEVDCSYCKKRAEYSHAIRVHNGMWRKRGR